MVTANGVMVAVMTMTPLHLRDHGGSLELVGLVMSVHVAGMFAFAPLVGSLADRRGSLPTAHAGTAMLVASAVLAAAPGHNHAVIGVALTMLGLGWSMATISGAALLIAAVPSEERARTQGVADTTMGIAGGAGGTVSGIVVGSVGYATLSLAGAVLTGAVLAALLLRRERHPQRSSTRTLTRAGRVSQLWGPAGCVASGHALGSANATSAATPEKGEVAGSIPASPGAASLLPVDATG